MDKSTKVSEITCPVCQSSNWTCWDESIEWFVDSESDEEYEAPYGHIRCNDCGRVYGHHWEAPNRPAGEALDR